MMGRYLKTGLFCAFFMMAAALGAQAQAAEQSGRIFMKTESETGYFTVNASPGEKKSVSVTLSNLSNELSADAELYVADAETTTGGGMATIAPNRIKKSDTGAWFAFEKQKVTLAPGENRSVSFDFEVPANAAPGDHVASIVLYKLETEQAPVAAEKNQAVVTANKAYSQTVAVLVKTPGALKTDLQLESLEPQWNGSQLFLNLKLKNGGSSIERPKGDIKIFKNGQEVFAKKAEMGSIYPRTEAFYSFEAPAEFKETGEYEVRTSWDFSQEKERVAKTFSYKLGAKEVNAAKTTELATERNKNGEQPLNKDAIIVTPQQIMKWIAWAAGAAAALGGIIGLAFAAAKRRKRKAKRVVFAIAEENEEKSGEEQNQQESEQTLSRAKSRGGKRKK